MDPLVLEKETEATRKEIQRKAMRVAPAYNKGAYQYEGEHISETLKNNKRR
jgi:hypothetical protein